jgi:hypothetical protein
MVATVPIHTAHRVAVSYERSTWGKAYRDVSDTGKCVRVSRQEVTCRFIVHTEGCTSSTDCIPIDWIYDVKVRRHTNTYLVWED